MLTRDVAVAAAVPRVGRKQARSFARATARINIWHGSIRSGKTFISIIRWMRYVATQAPAGGALVMIGNTRDTLGRNVLDVIKDLDPDALTWTRGAPTARLYGRLVHIVGASDVRAENRIRGLTVAGAYVDEASLLQEAMWTQMLGRMSVPGAMLFATTNPDSPAHWLRRKFLRRPELDVRHWHFVLADNPSLTPEYVAQVSAEFTGLWYERFIKGRWVAAEGAIYQALTEQHNAVPRGKEWEPLVIGVDYGTSNPTHAVLLSLDEQQERLHAVSEWRHDGRKLGALTDDEVSARMIAWAGGLGLDRASVPIVLDPSAASLRAQLRKDGWLVRSADNAVLDALRENASLFARRHLVVDTEHCPSLWDELLGYVWDSKASDDGIDRPLKQDDHGPDALRYAVRWARRYWRDWLAPDLEPEGDGVLMTDTRRRLLGLTRPDAA